MIVNSVMNYTKVLKHVVQFRDDDEDKSLMKEIDCEYGYCQGKPDWCPLKPLPEKKEERDWRSKLSLEWVRGWNTCISKITGGEVDGEIDT